ncbi:MAG TPA: BON domain-containing protein [Burkholderiaceae bacterium]|nr:BON domain-containing protein [Burkholderiaceae bacterium]
MTHPLTPLRLSRPLLRTAALAVSVAAAAAVLPGCVLLLGGAAVGGGLIVTDRRTSGAQLEDESIELKSSKRIREAIGDGAHAGVTSFNRVALVSGEVPTEADHEAVIRAVKGVDNVRNVDDELLVGPNASLSTVSSDTVITSRVKAALVEAKDLQANAIKVVTDRGNVYLMGIVTEREAARATDLARGVPGVMKVVRVFEVVSEAELANLQHK